MIQSRTHNSLSVDNKQGMLKYMYPIVAEISNSIGYPVKILDINRIDSYTKGVYHVITVLYNKKMDKCFSTSGVLYTRLFKYSK